MSINFKSYIKSPDECPFCHSTDIEERKVRIKKFRGRFSAKDIMAWRDIKCNKCERKWRVIFTITSVQSNYLD